MEEFELFPDEEEEAIAEEGTNRTFIILVGALGGLLVVGLCMFAVWAFVIAPRMSNDIEAQNQLTQATQTAAVAAQAAGETATFEAPTDTAEPPAPSDTPKPTETKAPTAVPATPEATSAEAATEGTPAAAASTPTETPNPIATRRPTATPGSGDVPNTGVGTLGASVLAVGLLFLLVAVRRMRRTV